MSYGEKENHWNILKCGGVLQRFTSLLIIKEKFDQKLLIVFSNYTIMESKDAIFFENIFPLKNKLSKSICDTSCSNLPSCSNTNKDVVF